MRQKGERNKTVLIFILSLFLVPPRNGYADFWGGDIPLLADIVINTTQQLTKLQSILGTEKETLALLEDVNRGIKEAMTIIETTNRTLHPGVLSDLKSSAELLRTIEQLYGKIPRSSSARLQGTIDANVAKSIHLHNEAFRYAAQVDPEAERIKEYARNVSPVGAQKLTAQSLGVLIHVMNQILRTNAAILKVQSQQLALHNRREKVNSEQHVVKYTEISKAFGGIEPNYKLIPLGK